MDVKSGGKIGCWKVEQEGGSRHLPAISCPAGFAFFFFFAKFLYVFCPYPWFVVISP